MIRVAIVEDHPAIADGLAALIHGSSDVSVVGTARDVRSASTLIDHESPDVVLCDIRLADASDALRVPTPRELEILALVAEGLSNAEIADRLSLRIKTVESQLRRLFDRYDVTSRTALVRLAARQGWNEEDR